MESKNLTNSNPEKIRTNDVTNRFLPLTDSVKKGLEREARCSDFKFLQHLGYGSYGVVELAMHKKTSVVYAIKKIDKTLDQNKDKQKSFTIEV